MITAFPLSEIFVSDGSDDKRLAGAITAPASDPCTSRIPRYCRNRAIGIDTSGKKMEPNRVSTLSAGEVEHVAGLGQQVLAGIDKQRFSAGHPALAHEQRGIGQFLCVG